MPLSRTRDYLSIGEVLETLKVEFPDITISKIRFLEAEGLINPERTPSGYRKFYAGDLDRLKAVLALQRDHFMPLKVIRSKLAEGNFPEGGLPPPPVPTRGTGEDLPDEPQPEVETDVDLDVDDLQNASGLSEEELGGLVEFGLLPPSGPYDATHLAAAQAARGLFKFGVEARHLRMYRQFAEREAGFFEQIVSPVARRRDPDAQREAAAAIEELTALSKRFREAVIAATLRNLT